MANKSVSYNKIIFLTFARLPSRAAHTVNIVKMCQAIQKIGLDVSLVSDARENAEEIFDYYNIQYPFNIKKIKCFNIRVFGRIFFLVKAFFYIREEQTDLLYTRDVFNAFLAKMLKRSFIFELHELPNNWFREFLMGKVLRSPNLKKVVYISKSLNELLESRFGDVLYGKPCITAHDGVDLRNFKITLSKHEARMDLNLPETAFIAGYTGSLFEGRGIEIILNLAVVLKDVFFVIVGGEGKYLNLLRRKVAKLNIDNVIVKGFMPHKKIPVFSQAADVLLMPYQKKVLHRQKKHDTAAFMSPLKMFEYMASGKPIIASRIKVLEEVLCDRENSLLVMPDNINEWAEAVLLLRNDRDLAEKLGKKAKGDVIKYTWDNRVEKIFEGVF